MSEKSEEAMDHDLYSESYLFIFYTMIVEDMMKTIHIICVFKKNIFLSLFERKFKIHMCEFKDDRNCIFSFLMFKLSLRFFSSQVNRRYLYQENVHRFSFF